MSLANKEEPERFDIEKKAGNLSGCPPFDDVVV
jgi:hypothetical protein